MYYKIQNVYYFGWNILLTGGVYLMVDTYNYFIILMRKWSYLHCMKTEVFH